MSADRGWSFRGRAARSPLTLLCAVLLALLGLASAAPAKAARQQRLVPVSVSVDLAHPLPPVAPAFLGFSFELSTLPQIASYAGRGNLVALLRSLGPGVLRFGGVAADISTAWHEPGTPLAPWAMSAIEPADLRALARLAEETGWRVLLTIGLGHPEPEAAAREAAAAKSALGESLEAIELGNEPEAYARHGLRSEPWGIVQYDAQLAEYRAAIEAAAPGIPLAGPDSSGSAAFETWGPDETVDERPALLTGHHYPLGCNSRPPPTIARLLSPHVQAAEEISLAKYMTVSQRSETPFLLDETNTVSCGGVTGISNTFAAALWAAGYLPHAMKAGVTGINLHANRAVCGGYAPLCAANAEALAAGKLVVQPEWYALVMLRGLVGQRPLPTYTSSVAQSNLQVTAFLAAGGGLSFMIVDDDPPRSRAVRLRLHVGAGFRGGQVLALTAPSPESVSGVRLGGRRIASDGAWTPPRRLPRAKNRGGAVEAVIRPSSAALVTVSAR